jgi:hypothetical protein
MKGIIVTALDVELVFSDWHGIDSWTLIDSGYIESWTAYSSGSFSYFEIPNCFLLALDGGGILAGMSPLFFLLAHLRILRYLIAFLLAGWRLILPAARLLSVLR